MYVDPHIQRSYRYTNPRIIHTHFHTPKYVWLELARVEGFEKGDFERGRDIAAQKTWGCWVNRGGAGQDGAERVRERDEGEGGWPTARDQYTKIHRQPVVHTHAPPPPHLYTATAELASNCMRKYKNFKFNYHIYFLHSHYIWEVMRFM